MAMPCPELPYTQQVSCQRKAWNSTTYLGWEVQDCSAQIYWGCAPAPFHGQSLAWLILGGDFILSSYLSYRFLTAGPPLAGNARNRG